MFKSKTEFSLHIENLRKENSCTYIEALLDYAESTGAHDEEIAKMISPSLKEKIALEAQEDYILQPRTDASFDYGDDDDLL